MIDKYNEAGIPALEEAEQGRAKPAEKCIYPKCEDCDKYHGHWCTVPMVVSKQDYILINDKIDDLMKRVFDLENVVTDVILGSHDGRVLSSDGNVFSSEAHANYTWDDCFKESK